MPSDTSPDIIASALAAEKAHGEKAHIYARGRADVALADGDAASAEKWNAAADMLCDLHSINCPPGIRPPTTETTDRGAKRKPS